MLMPHNRGLTRAYRETKKFEKRCILYIASMNKGCSRASYFQRCRSSHGAREAPKKALMVVVVVMMMVVAMVRWRWYVWQEERWVLVKGFFVALEDRNNVIKLRSFVRVGRPALHYHVAYCHWAWSRQWWPSILHKVYQLEETDRWISMLTAWIDKVMKMNIVSVYQEPYLHCNSNSSLLRSHVIERNQSSQNLPHDDSKAVHINFPSMMLLFDHFWSHPPVGSCKPLPTSTLWFQAWNPKICHFDWHILSQKYILRLQVSMKYTLRVEVAHPPSNI